MSFSSAAAMHVPPYESHEGNQAVATDDFYARLDSGETEFGDGGLDLALGRVSVRTLEAALAFVDKVKAFEDPALAGTWRARAVLSADDHLQRNPRNGNLDRILGGHTNDSERIGESMSQGDPGLTTDHVYLLDYPLTSSNRKPEASQDLIALLNRGALVVNFVGHGSANQWADEVLLQTGDALTALENRGRAGA